MMMMLHPVCCDILTHHVVCCVLRSCSCCLTHSSDATYHKVLTPETRRLRAPPNVLITHLWPTVVQHTAAHARYVTHALRPMQGQRGNPSVFSGTGGRGLLGQRLGALAPQGHLTLRGGARMTWLFRVRPGNVKP
jgi:hypothetical protein